MAFSNLFDVRRTAQAAAFLLHRAGGTLYLIKLIKLLYLAERESLKRFGEPITGDSLVSMPHGPVLSQTLDLINGAVESPPWDDLISDRAGRLIALRDPNAVTDPTRELLELSESDVEVLDAVWAQFGAMDRWDLVRYTHSQAIPEWEDPEGSSTPITYKSLFAAVGYSPDQVAALTSRLREQSELAGSH